MSPAGKIIKKVRESVQTATYGNSLYKKFLATGAPVSQLHFTLPDLWPGDARIGMSLIADQGSMFDRFEQARPTSMCDMFRNLRAVGTDAARFATLRLIESWLRHYDDWSLDQWSPEQIAERLVAWISFFEFYGPAASPMLVAQITTSLCRQFRHYLRAVSPETKGMQGMEAIFALIYSGLNFQDGDKALGLALEMLRRRLDEEILPDGGHISRNPSTLVHMLRLLISVRSCLRAAEIKCPDGLDSAIAAMVPALKFLRHGDGGLALFHGSVEESSLLLDAILTQAETRVRRLPRLPQSGYERLTAGRSLLLVDVATPPARGYDADAHAGVLSFEFGHGRERLLVNCGAVIGPSDPAWRVACAATAAHSTITVADTNACDVLASGGLGGSVIVDARRFVEGEDQIVEMSHNGYVSSHGVTHQRTLRLDASGDTLSGVDTLYGPDGKDYTLRWHLHPDVQASLLQGGDSVLLRSASGQGWRLRINGGDFALESSVYCGSGQPRRTLQIRANGRTKREESKISWSLVREKKN